MHAKILPADTAMCTLGQTDGHNSHDHTTSQANIEWNSLGPQATLLEPLAASQDSYVLFLRDLIESAKSHL